jgi:TRAP-type C4-dicarboxylate transport system substrate-binding protein
MQNIQTKIKTELEEFQKAGVSTMQLSSDEAAKFSKMADDALMEVVLKKVPEEGKKLKALITKK